MKTAKVLSTAALTIVFSTLATLPAMAAEQPVSPKAEQSIQNSLPNVAILATGGTTASKGAGALALTDY